MPYSKEWRKKTKTKQQNLICLAYQKTKLRDNLITECKYFHGRKYQLLKGFLI